MSDLRIRPACRADGPAYLALVTALANFEKLAPPSPAARRRLLADAFGRKPRYRMLVAETERGVVAYAVFFFTYSTFLARPTLYLEDIFVHPDARGRGVATEMMQRLAEIARKEGCGRFEWTVLDWNKPARRLYRKLGAREMKQWVLCRLEGIGVGKLERRR